MVKDENPEIRTCCLKVVLKRAGLFLFYCKAFVKENLHSLRRDYCHTSATLYVGFLHL